MRNNQLVVVNCINQKMTDEYIRRYQTSTKNAIENILGMGEAVYEICLKSKSGELSKDDLEYFCKSVSLDSKGSTFRKYKAIGQNAIRFRECMERLPCSFSVLYEMATLSGDEFIALPLKVTKSVNGLTVTSSLALVRPQGVAMEFLLEGLVAIRPYILSLCQLLVITGIHLRWL